MKYSDFIESQSSGIIGQPYIIAEAGVNHEGSMDTAKRLIDEALEGGAHAIKFQSYKAETLASKDSPFYWDISKEPTRSQYELFKKHDSFWKKEFEELAVYCETVGIEFMSTPFDIESADFLNDLMGVYKISSSDITNKPFIQYMCRFKKPVILSVGASYLPEIQEAVGWIQQQGNPLALLHCVLNYPTSDENAGLGQITELKRVFKDLFIGYSDHTLPKDMTTCLTAVLLGARIIEKHFTHDKTLPGNDHYHAMDKQDLKQFNDRLQKTLTLLGGNSITSLESEETSRKNARRSLVARNSIAKGQIIKREDLTWKRPAFGISPREIDSIIGKKVLKDISEDEILYYDFIDFSGSSRG